MSGLLNTPKSALGGIASVPGTPIHTIHSMRRKGAGHHGPLTKLLVANRGVCLIYYLTDALADSMFTGNRDPCL